MATRARSIAGWILTGLVGAGFLLAGGGKLGGAAGEMFVAWGYAPWFATVIGVLEVAGGIGLFVPALTRWAVLGLAGIMLGAVYTHLANGEGPEVLRPVIFLVLLGGIWMLRVRRD